MKVFQKPKAYRLPPKAKLEFHIQIKANTSAGW